MQKVRNAPTSCLIYHLILIGDSLSTKRFDLIEYQPSDRHVTTTKYQPYILEADAFFHRHIRDESLREKYSYKIVSQNNFEITKITIIINKDLEDT